MTGRRLVMVLAAVLLGTVAGEVLCRWPVFRDLAGRVSGRGGLVHIVNDRGIYETDLGGDDNVDASDAVLAEKLRRAAAGTRLEATRVEEQFTLLLNQFADAKKFDQAVRSAGLSDSALREKLAEHLRQLDWLEQQIKTDAAVAEQECRQFFGAHGELFNLPVRYRAAHVFLAAHAETPPEVAAEKEKAVAALALRLKKGELLSQLAAEASEDEATKNRGGDLGYFSEMRMPAEFMAEIKRLRVGETSKAFRSHLGFHIVQLTEIKPARVLSFEEARSEIAVALANERRGAAVARITRGENSAFASR